MLAILSGCSTYGGSKKTAKVGGVILLTGFPLAVLGGAAVAGSRPDVSNGQKGWQCRDAACPWIFGSLIAGLVLEAVGLGIVVGGAIGVVVVDKPEAVRPSPELRSPSIEGPFWCQRETGICTGDHDTCGPDCLGATSIWCAPYRSVAGEPGFLCGLSNDACFVLAASQHNRRGQRGLG